MGLYTFLYGNPLYRLYTTGIQPPLLVTARLSRYTAHTAHTAIQPYTPYIIQRHTASLRVHLELLGPVLAELRQTALRSGRHAPRNDHGVAPAVKSAAQR